MLQISKCWEQKIGCREMWYFYGDFQGSDG